LKPVSNTKLARIYRFFETYGRERLDGLDESYFAELSQPEKKEAWNFLDAGIPSSYEHIKGLYLLDRDRAIQRFSKALALPIEQSQYPSEREQLESSRLLMLSYVNCVEHDPKILKEMTEFAKSEFSDIRGQLARALPVQNIIPEAVKALKTMILTETNIGSRAAAITKFMSIHGLKFKLKDPVYDATYLALRSDDPEEKLSAINKLEKTRQPHQL
jgi:hypothetical protein